MAGNISIVASNPFLPGPIQWGLEVRIGKCDRNLHIVLTYKVPKETQVVTVKYMLQRNLYVK